MGFETLAMEIGSKNRLISDEPAIFIRDGGMPAQRAGCLR